MSSNSNRARKRAIRAEMDKTGDNHTRAAHTASGRPSVQLRAVCFTCRRNIPAGGGAIHIAMYEVQQVERARAAAQKQREAKAAEEGPLGGGISMADLLDESEPEDAQWQVHCDECNPHRDDGCDGCYWFAVERCSTWAQLVEWTVHLAEKEWVLTATNWLQFIRATAHGESEIGLICRRADRYKDTAC
ncbi:hypothetical protein GCM10022247_36120 [Allokutzneria multivorans]|uniref:Uncharacterized protein n=1 Tax=Allokutzneria multivorans TaxID=1142134 RepID=A0ABP7SEF7_9PSEU